MAVTIDVESPLQHDVRVLIAELNAHLLTLTPPEFCSHMTVEDMADGATTVFVARDDGAAIACGARAATRQRRRRRSQAHVHDSVSSG